MAKINTWILYHQHFRQNGKPHKDQKSLLQFNLELSDALILANKVNPSSSVKTNLKNEEIWKHWPQVKSLLKHCLSHWCSFWSSHTLAKPYYQQKLMHIMQFDLQNTMFQKQDIPLFTGWLQLCHWFPYKTMDKYLHILIFFPNRKVLVIKIIFLPFKS